MAVSSKRYIPNEEETKNYVESLNEAQLEKLIGWWLLYTKSRADERDTAFWEIPEDGVKAYVKVFKNNLMTSKTKKSDAFALMQKVLLHLQRNPERITPNIYESLINEPKLHWVVSLVSRSTDESGNVFLVPSKSASSALNALDAQTAINIQNLGVIKLKEIVEAMTRSKIQMSNLGTLSKAGRDLVSMLHILGIDFKPDQELISEYKEITESDGKTRRERMTRYIQKNQKEWNGG